MPSTSSEISRDLQSEECDPPQTIIDILPTSQTKHLEMINMCKLQRKRNVTIYGERNAVDLPIRGARQRYE